MVTEITRLYEIKARKRANGIYTTEVTRNKILVPIGYIKPLTEDSNFLRPYTSDRSIDSVLYMFAEQTLFFKRWIAITNKKVNDLVVEAVHKRSEQKPSPMYWQLQGVDGDELLKRMEQKSYVKVHHIKYKGIGFLIEPTDTLAQLLKSK